jgi:hypothetical protein
MSKFNEEMSVVSDSVLESEDEGMQSKTRTGTFNPILDQEETKQEERKQKEKMEKQKMAQQWNKEQQKIKRVNEQTKIDEYLLKIKRNKSKMEKVYQGPKKMIQTQISYNMRIKSQEKNI